MKCQNEAEFDHTIDNIVRSVMIYSMLTFTCMRRSMNVLNVNLNAQRNLDLFLVDILGYQIMIDPQL